MERKELFNKILPKRTIPIFGDINAELYFNARDELLRMGAESGEPITLLFDSGGGNLLFAMNLGDLIQTLQAEVIGVVLEAKSSAAILVQYCTKRLIIPSGRLLVHSSRFHMENCSYKFIEELVRNAAKDSLDYQRRMVAVLCSRSGLSEERVTELMKKGDDLIYLIYAAEAVELNLVDGILPADFKLFTQPAPKNESPGTEEKIKS